jgi:hypothetical protein
MKTVLFPTFSQTEPGDKFYCARSNSNYVRIKAISVGRHAFANAVNIETGSLAAIPMDEIIEMEERT